MREQPGDFTGKTLKVTLTSGNEIVVSTPTLRFYDYITTRLQYHQRVATPAEIKGLADSIKSGQASEAALRNSGTGLLDIIYDVAIWFFIKHKKQWQLEYDAQRDYVMDELYSGDLIAILTAFLQVEDIQRIMDFFVQCRSLLIEAAGTSLTKGKNPPTPQATPK